MRRIRRLSVMLFVLAVLCFAAMECYTRFFVDQSGPVITMDRDSITVPADADEAQLLQGISAMDKTDGDVTDGIVLEGLGNFIDGNTRKMTVAAVDSNGHVTKASREVVYESYEAPKFALKQPLKFAVGVTDILENLKASDVLDGNIKDQIKISSKYSLKVDEPGDYPMLFTVTNSAGDVSKLKATVTIYTAADLQYLPDIRLSEYLVYTSGERITPRDYIKALVLNDVKYRREGDVLRASDGTEIPLSDISIENAVNYRKNGCYEIVYRYGTKETGKGETRLIVVVRK